MDNGSASGLTRRTMISGAAVAGVGVPLLAACGAGATPSNPLVARQQEQRDGATSSDPIPLVKAGDVPVGGGVIVADAVVTQPSEGGFKAFTNICTHQGCKVTSVSDQLIHCPCHGSAFSILDGSVRMGPAPSPLAEIAVRVVKDEVVAD